MGKPRRKTKSSNDKEITRLTAFLKRRFPVATASLKAGGEKPVDVAIRLLRGLVSARDTLLKTSKKKRP